MSKLRIKNFGPIKEGLTSVSSWIEFKKVTILIGNQGTGKSCIAKLYSTMRWLEKSLNRGTIKPSYALNRGFIQNIAKYQNFKSYLKPDTEIEYIGEIYHFKYYDSNFSIHILTSPKNYSSPKIMYIPAERNLISVLNNTRQFENLPRPLSDFMEDYLKALRSSSGNGIALPVNNIHIQYDSNTDTINIIGDNEADRYKINIQESSSGVQSLAPLYIVSKYLSDSMFQDEDTSLNDLIMMNSYLNNLSAEKREFLQQNIKTSLAKKSASSETTITKNFMDLYNDIIKSELKKFKNSRLINIVEEPEQNLFPASQRTILYKLLEFNNSKDENELILTTHSPYTVSYINLLIQANILTEDLNYKLRKNRTANNKFRTEINKIVPLQSIIHKDDIVVYSLDAGKITILDKIEEVLSDDNQLNNLLEEINSDFSQLLQFDSLIKNINFNNES